MSHPLLQVFQPGEPGYDQALEEVINQQVGNSPSELTLTEEEDTGPERAAIEAAARNEAEGTTNTTNTSGTGSGTGSAGGNNAATNDPYAGVTYTSPYQSGALQHIFEGEVNSNGRAVGYHWEGLPNTPGEVVPGTETAPDPRGVYWAQVEVNGVRKRGGSSFFPRLWSMQEVLNSIDEAYNNRIYLLGNTYVGETSTGIVIQMFLNNQDEIISAFPWYEPNFP